MERERGRERERERESERGGAAVIGFEGPPAKCGSEVGL